MAAAVPKTFFSLNTQGKNNKMPVIGFGTFRIHSKKTIYDVLDAALGAGYRLIDTAAVYSNEHFIRDALEVLLPKYNLKREDLFITSKLAPKDHGDKEKVTAAVHESLKNLGTSYIDLYLIHWPGAGSINVKSPENPRLRKLTWKTLMKLHDHGNGPLKNIGVSNYTVKHLKEMFSDPDNIVPAVNQVEFHPYYQQSSEFHQLCKDNKIVLQAYCSMGGSAGNEPLLQDEIINRIAKKHTISPAQVLLRWAIQRNYGVIPKSINPERIRANFDLNKELDESDMVDINNIKYKEKFAWQPEDIL